MSKKNFTGGLNSLLGEKPTAKKNTKELNQENALKYLKELNKKVGRPVTQTKEITKSSQEGTKENETRATFIVNEDLLEKLKAIAYWDRLLIKDVINTAFEETISKHEKRHGTIKPIPTK